MIFSQTRTKGMIIKRIRIKTGTRTRIKTKIKTRIKIDKSSPMFTSLQEV